MHSKITIRRASIEDIDHALSLWLIYTCESVEDPNPDVEHWVAREKKYLSCKDYYRVMAFDGKNPIATIGGVIVYDPSISKKYAEGFGEFYVDPEYRGTSVGARVYLKLRKMVQSEGCAFIRMNILSSAGLMINRARKRNDEIIGYMIKEGF